MKTQRKLLSLFLAVFLLISGLPVSSAAAESKVLVFEGTSHVPDREKSSMDYYSLSYDVELTVTVDMAAKTATGAWTRTNCVLSWDDQTYNAQMDKTEGQIAYDRFRENFKDDADKAEAVIREFAGDTSPHAFKAKAEYWGSAQQGVNGNYSIALTEFEWQSEPFRVDEESSPITEQKWKYVRAIIVNASSNSKYNTSPGHWSTDPKAQYTYSDLQKNAGNLGNFKMYMKLQSGEAVKREFTMGTDSFKFSNHMQYFYNMSEEEVKNYDAGLGFHGLQVSDETHNKLTQGRSNAQIAKLNQQMKEATGACFGMSAVAGMLFWGDLSISSLDTDAVSTNHLGYPKYNEALRDIIIYYHMMQSDRELSEAIDGLPDKDFKEMVEVMEKDLPEKPVILCLSEKGKKIDEGKRHAVLAYKLEKVYADPYDYIAYLYDPNDPVNTVRIAIHKDRSGWDQIKDTNDVEFSKKWSINAAISLTEIKRLWDYAAPGADQYLMKVEGEQSSIIVPWGRFVVERGTKKAVIMDGVKISGDLEVQSLGAAPDAGGDPTYHFMINGVDGPLTISGNSQITVYSGNGGGKATTVLAQGISERSKLTVYPDGTAELENPTSSDYVLSIASDLTTSDIFITTVTGKGMGAQIKPQINGAKVTTPDGGKVDVEACGKTKYAVFRDVSSENDIIVKNSGMTSTLTDKNGRELKKGAASENGGGDLLKGTFQDVPADAYYAAAVDWAVKNEITSGTSSTAFSPNDSCTRAQAVTFLWRAVGSPEPKGNAAFRDVKPGSYYEKAVRWAVERQITNGTGGGKFSPNKKCTRAEIVTFLWRYHSRAKVYRDDVFTDVKYGSYYYDAVIWAYKHDITSGTGKKTFSPHQICSRAQIVTFLYRNPFSYQC